jgi:hypothetical protein
MTAPSTGAGTHFVLAYSSFRGDSAPNITHATAPSGDKTLCGRACENWVQETFIHYGPDCLACMKVWKRLGGTDTGSADGY